MLAGVCAALGSSILTASAQTAFDRATQQEIDGPSGSIVRQEPMVFAPDYISAYRVLYCSRGLHGEPIAVSGLAIAPRGAPPPGGRSIVAWSHPTTAVVTRYAPAPA